MRPIKFRGKRSDNGEFVYGDLQTHFRTDGKTKAFVIRTWERLDDWVVVAPNKSVIVAEYHERPVEPDSVAQLVGYDAKGNEVYEGDTIEFNGCTYTARLEEYWAGDIPAGELCSAIQDVIHTLRPVRLWQESITHVIRIEGEDSPSLPVHRKKLAEAYPPFKTACERFIAAYQDFTKELEATK